MTAPDLNMPDFTMPDFTMPDFTMPDFTGSLLLRGEDGYEAARAGGIFNDRCPARHPAAILLARDDADLVAGVRLAAGRGWAVTVRGGGHSWAGWSLRDGGLLVDVGALDTLAYDGSTGIVVAGGGVRGGQQLAPFLAERGRAFPGGHCPSVGIGGFLLQGGQGWNGRLRGWACESVVALDVVTATGELLRVDATQHADLYWAARGAGPGFPGIVARFHLQTYKAPGAFWHDTWTFRLTDAEELLHWLHAQLPGLDRRVEPVIAATRLRDVPLHPGVEHPGGTVLLLHTTCMGDSEDEAIRLLSALANGPLAGRELGRVTGPTSIAAESAAQEAQNPQRHRYAVDNAWSDAPADRLAPMLARLWSELDTEHSFSIWYGWAPTRTLPDMAFSVEGNVYVATYVIYTDPADDERHRSWVHERTGEISADGGVGQYLGDSDHGRRHDRVLSPEHMVRLDRVRAAWDPTALFAGYLGAGEGFNTRPGAGE